MSVGGSKGGGQGQSAVSVPQFLEPFVRQSTGIAGDALGGLADLIAPRTEAEYTGPPIELNGVRGPNGAVFVSPQQNAFVDAAGNVVAPFQDGTVPGLIHGNNNPVRVVNGQVVGQGSLGQEEIFSMPQGDVDFSGLNENLVAGFRPAQIEAQQRGLDRALGGFFDPAQSAVGDIAGQGVDTSAISALGLGLSPGVASGLQSQIGGPLAGTDALESTAAGDFLFGGDGFDAAVDAAVRRATPGILSTFGAAGAGGATGGLAQEALGTAAIDAFASQFANERRNQLGAAGQLAGLDLAQTGQNVDTLGLLGNLGLAGGDQELRQAQFGVNADLQNSRNQLAAAQLLPGLASADLDLLNRIGNMQQEQAQAELDAPRNALLQLLTASLGGTPITSLLGENTRARQTGFEAGAGIGDILAIAGLMA